MTNKRLLIFKAILIAEFFTKWKCDYKKAKNKVIPDSWIQPGWLPRAFIIIIIINIFFFLLT